jgi:NADP-dependent 3-hydroxy acid dehydrogenase YdfG
MSTSLAHKVVLITGASSGFGADAALLFARQGCRVVLAARRLDRLQAVVERIQAEGGQALAIPMDVSNRRDIENMVQATIDAYGHIDILFNNAGFGRQDWLEKLDPERDIDTQVNVNLLGVIHTARAVLPHMLVRRSGHIINMSSVGGLIAAPLYTVYCATKYGVRAFTDALRREVSPFHIKVTGIYPGPAVTEFDQHLGKNSSTHMFSKLGWIKISSEYVARRVVDAARHPRRNVIIPWWFRIITGFDTIFPGVVDWILRYAFTRRFHTIEEREE